MTAPPPDVNVTIREVYGLIQSVRTEILAEITKVSLEWHTRLDAHQVTHDREHEKRTSITRWAVTTVLSGIGVLTALYFGLR